MDFELSSLNELTGDIRVADVLDVAVIGLLLYWALAWFRERASHSLLIGFALALALYVGARWLDMYLTTMLFQAGFMIVLLALIVVFQQDLRRGFERLAVWRPFRRPTGLTPTSQTIDTLAESIALLAENRIGALLVFEGREPLDRHIRGGVDVDARLSMPLLCSIFNPESPGHDGAVLIDGERIEKLGVHLPLSKNLAEIGHGGTRHAAALGLAECCDAMVIVVSEERGTIGFAEHGRLTQIEPSELSAHLQRCYQQRTSLPPRLTWHHALRRNVGLKLTALVMACGLWLLLAYRVEPHHKTFVVPIEYRNLPENWVVEEPRPTHAEVTLAGPERDFRLLDVRALAISFDLSHLQLQTPTVFRTDHSLKNVPAGLHVNQIQPRAVEITVRRVPSG